MGLMVAGVGFVGYEVAKVGDLGPSLQKVAQNIDSVFKGIGAPGGTGGGTGTGKVGCFDSTTLGLASWIGVQWCITHTAPPADIPTLQAWGNTAGFRNSTTGVWAFPSTGNT